MLDPRRALWRQVVRVRRDADAPEVEVISVPSALDGGVGADLATAVVADGVGEAVELRGLQLKEHALQRARVIGAAAAVVRVAPFVLALAVVQEREELRHQKIRTSCPRHRHGVVRSDGGVGIGGGRQRQE
jgi:hypothetical protein